MPTENTPPALLEAKALTVEAGRRRLVREADFRLASGEWKALVGPNGAGKTTLLKACATLMTYRGELRYQGRPVGVAGKAYRAALGVVLHESLLFRELTAKENLIFYAKLYGVRIVTVEEQLERVGLGPFAHEYVKHFSRGMEQRLSLARALLHRPRLLLLDEPLAGLDDEGAEQILAFFGQAREDGVAALWVTHRWDRAWNHVDEVLQMQQGGICARVSTADAAGETWRPHHAASRSSSGDVNSPGEGRTAVGRRSQEDGPGT